MGGRVARVARGGFGVHLYSLCLRVAQSKRLPPGPETLRRSEDSMESALCLRSRAVHGTAGNTEGLDLTCLAREARGKRGLGLRPRVGSVLLLRESLVPEARHR